MSILNLTEDHSLTIPDAARFIREQIGIEYHRSSVLNWIRAGRRMHGQRIRLPAVYASGKGWRLRAQDIVHFLTECDRVEQQFREAHRSTETPAEDVAAFEQLNKTG